MEVSIIQLFSICYHNIESFSRSLSPHEISQGVFKTDELLAEKGKTRE